MITPKKKEAVRNRYGDEFFDKKDALGKIVLKAPRIHEGARNLQNVHTPYDLFERMISKSNIKIGNKILVLNLEAAIVLIEQGHKPSDICFLTDCEQKAKFGKTIGVEIMSEDFFDFFEKVNKKEEVRTWDAVIGNPPYQDPKNKRKPLWQDFVTLAFGIVKQDGIVSLIHPSSWRKAEAKLFELFREKNLNYLEIHNQQDGMKTFNCGTRYDWYVLTNKPNHEETEIVDENGISYKLSIKNIPFIPNSLIDRIMSLVAMNGEAACELMISYSNYETRKSWMSEQKDASFCYPCIHTINGSGPSFWYSKTKNNGFFGIPKVVFYDGNISNCYYDSDGVYGMTQHAFGFPVKNKKEAEIIMSAVRTKEYQEIAKALIWAGFAFDFRALKYFKKNFWESFVRK